MFIFKYLFTYLISFNFSSILNNVESVTFLNDLFIFNKYKLQGFNNLNFFIDYLEFNFQKNYMYAKDINIYFYSNFKYKLFLKMFKSENNNLYAEDLNIADAYYSVNIKNIEYKNNQYYFNGIIIKLSERNFYKLKTCIYNDNYNKFYISNKDFFYKIFYTYFCNKNKFVVYSFFNKDNTLNIDFSFSFSFSFSQIFSSFNIDLLYKDVKIYYSFEKNLNKEIFYCNFLKIYLDNDDYLVSLDILLNNIFFLKMLNPISDSDINYIKLKKRDIYFSQDILNFQKISFKNKDISFLFCELDSVKNYIISCPIFEANFIPKSQECEKVLILSTLKSFYKVILNLYTIKSNFFINTRINDKDTEIDLQSESYFSSPIFNFFKIKSSLKLYYNLDYRIFIEDNIYSFKDLSFKFLEKTLDIIYNLSIFDYSFNLCFDSKLNLKKFSFKFYSDYFFELECVFSEEKLKMNISYFFEFFKFDCSFSKLGMDLFVEKTFYNVNFKFLFNCCTKDFFEKFWYNFLDNFLDNFFKFEISFEFEELIFIFNFYQKVIMDKEKKQKYTDFRVLPNTKKIEKRKQDFHEFLLILNEFMKNVKSIIND